MKAIGIVMLAIICLVAAQGTSIPLFFYLFYLLLGLLLLAYLWARINLHGLHVTREAFKNRAQVGEEARGRLVLENHWPFPKLWVEVEDHSDMPLHPSGFVTYLPANATRRWIVRTPCVMRGKWTIGPATLQSGDPFGIFRVQRDVDATAEIIVYPATVDLPNFKLPTAELPGGSDVRSRTFHVTPNVSTIRGYTPGDSFNRIHWKSTARSGSLMVKEFELDPTADVWIVADMHSRSQVVSEIQRTLFYDRRLDQEIEAPETTEEYIVSIAASLSRQLLNGNRNLGMLAWGQHREVIPPERESRQIYKIFESLAILRAQGNHRLAEVLVAEGAQFSKSATVIVITASVDPTWVNSLEQLIHRGVQTAVVLIDPQTFGGWPGADQIVSKLSELRVPVYRVEQGQPLDTALGQPVVAGVKAAR
jgi:uncharacterized protein (DUF58 family)